MKRDDAITITKEFTDLVKEQFPVDRVYLFGSYAINKANIGSDIDVCVVSSAFGKDYSSEEFELIKLAMKIDSRISPVPSSPQDIQNRWSQLAHEITTHGIQIV